MKKSNRRLFWLLPVVALVIAIGVGCAIWNKPHAKAENQTATIVPADKIFSDFSGNEQSANAQYLNKVIQVSGKATEVTKNQDGFTVALIEVNDPMGGVQCTMREKDVMISQNSTVNLKGFCNGFTSVVLLSDCVAAQ